jgi:TadE-like protein
MKRTRNRRGQSLVESTFVLAAFMSLLFGIAQVAETLFTRQTLVQRANAAARWGAMHPYDPHAIRNVALFGSARPGEGATAVFGLNESEIQVSNPGCPGPSCRITVAIPAHGVRSVEPVEESISGMAQ